MNRELAFYLIEHERQRQVEQWGLAEEDRHSLSEWALILEKHEGKLADAILSGDLERVERKLVTIAAISVAALESYFAD